MGADDEITSDVIHANGNKLIVFSDNKLIVGFVGALTTQNVMAREDSAFAKINDLTLDKEVNAAFDAFQNVAGFQMKGASEKQFWCEVLMAQGSTLLYMGNVAGWYRVTDNFRCIGSGGIVATGAMHVMQNEQPKVRIERAIEAASRYVAGVGQMTRYEHT